MGTRVHLPSPLLDLLPRFGGLETGEDHIDGVLTYIQKQQVKFR